MKKMVRVISLLVLTLSLGIALTACGGGKEEGKYVLEEDGSSFTIELKDGKVTFTEDEGHERVIKGTYKIDGDKIKITLNDEGEEIEVNGTIKPGESITIAFVEGYDMTLKYKK